MANKALAVNPSTGAIVAPVSATTFRNANGLQIGLNIQAWSADLDSFVTQATWTGANLALAGGLQVNGSFVADDATHPSASVWTWGTGSQLILSAGSTLSVTGTLDLVGTLDVSGVTNKTTARSDLGLLEPRFHFPRTAQVIYNNRFSGTKSQFSVGFVGDSLAELSQQMEIPFTDQLGIAGICVGGGIGATGGPTFTGTGQFITGDFTRWWKGAYDQLAAADTAIYNWNTEGPVFADTIKVYYLKESGAGTFRIQTSLNGGAYSTEGSDVDTNNASASSGVVTIDKSSASGMYAVKLVGISGTVRILGVRFSHSNLQGMVPFSIAYSGTDFDNWDDCPAAVLQPVLSDLAPKILYFCNTGDTTLVKLDTMQSRLNTATGGGYDLFISGVWPNQPQTEIAQNLILREWAQTNNFPYGSPTEIWPTWVILNAQGYATDVTHPTYAAVNLWMGYVAKAFTYARPNQFNWEGIATPIGAYLLKAGVSTGDVQTGFDLGGNLRVLGGSYSFGITSGFIANDRADGYTVDPFTIYRDTNVNHFADQFGSLMTLTNSAGSAVLNLLGGSASVTLNSVAVPTISSTSTLTNKTISGASNTITNVSLTTGVTGTLPIANGGTAKTSLPGFSAQGNGGANQAVPSAVFTKVTCFGSEIFDDGNWFSSNTGTVPVTGYYLVGAKITLNNPAAGTRLAIEIYKNGSSLVRVADDKMTGTSTQSKNGTMVVSLTAGDTIDVYIYQDKGSDVDVENNSGTSFFAKLIP